MNVKRLISDIKAELYFDTARSGGKGGQHVNKVETKVSIKWLYKESNKLSEHAKEKIDNFNHNLIKEDFILISSEKTRSQLKNKKDVLYKLEQLLVDVFKVHKKRKETRVPKGVNEKRIKNKKEKGITKSKRKKINPKDF